MPENIEPNTTESTETTESIEMEATVSTAEPEIRIEKPKRRRKILSEAAIEYITVILLGITAFLTAWTSWIGSMHSENQNMNYAEYSILYTMATSQQNVSAQSLFHDMSFIRDLTLLEFEYEIASASGHDGEMFILEEKMDSMWKTSMSPELYEVYQWAQAESEIRGEYVSPFEKDGLGDAYIADAIQIRDEAREYLAESNKDNAKAGACDMIVVIYSAVMFTLGINSVIKRQKSKTIILVFSTVIFAAATIYLFVIPLPTNFNIINTFAIN